MKGLDERKLKILEGIIRTYLETGEPVGSRTISKHSDLNLSSATIRNEMSDLEDMGYIIQPYTSAGRIPSDKGYRLYVDLLMEERIKEVEVIKGIMIEKVDHLESLLQEVAEFLAVTTKYATMVTSPYYKKRLKFIHLTEVDKEQLLVIVVFEGNIVKNKIIRLSKPFTKKIILKLNLVLNTFLQGLDLSEINLSVITQIKDQAGEYKEIVNDILDAIMRAVTEEDDVEIFTSGATNILRYPELSYNDNAYKLLYTFEEKKTLSDVIHSMADNNNTRQIQIYIGSETSLETMQDCSLVTGTYVIEEGVYGNLGIVGPKRMDYEKVVSTLHSLKHQLEDIFRKKT